MNVVHRISLVITCLFLTACHHENSAPPHLPEAHNGEIELREWDFEKQGPVHLIGEWAFFWNELRQPGHIKEPYEAHFVTVPDIWINYDLEGKIMTTKGGATYALRVYLPDAKHTYGLHIKGEGNAYSLWIDDRLSAQNGQVGTDIQSMTPETKPVSVFFRPEEVEQASIENALTPASLATLPISRSGIV